MLICAYADGQDWSEWDYRAFMEKRRRHEQQYADFVRRQNAVGQYEYLNISPMNDHRFLSNYIDQTGELPGRATHEEFMNVRNSQWSWLWILTCLDAAIYNSCCRMVVLTPHLRMCSWPCS